MPRRGDNIKQLPNGRYQARYRRMDGREAAKNFDRQVDAARWRHYMLAARDHDDLDSKAGRVELTVRFASRAELLEFLADLGQLGAKLRVDGLD